MAAVPGNLTADAAGPGGRICPAPGQDCPSFAGFLHILMSDGFAACAQHGRTVFSVSGDCTACGACVAACPANNIVMSEDRPARGNRCGLCRACVSACPVQAIRIEDIPGTGSEPDTTGENHP
jgi:Formate hydrogenlyase subunit 6/NADH:ubiquinone oxidoreductase 23 kD subunit (chain I)